MIYQNFLEQLSYFKTNLNFNGGSNVQIGDNNSKQSIKYFFGDKSVIVALSKKTSQWQIKKLLLH